jgi:hypothetical protein
MLFFVAICGFAQDEHKDLNFLIENFDSRFTLRLSIEGEFCNSGEREIIGFYQWKSTLALNGGNNNVLHIAYCFIINERTESVLQVYEVPIGGIYEFDETDNLTSMPGDVLGRSVEWLGYTIGYAGDFNRNGREELNFYSLSGMGFIPWFCEFSPDSDEFTQILEYPNPVGMVIILAIDPEQKKILFHGASRDIVSTLVQIFAFQWDERAQKYVESTWTEPVTVPINTHTQYYFRADVDNVAIYHPGLNFLFQIEGNFTNSSGKEIIRFYWHSGRYIEGRVELIEDVFCYVLDSQNRITAYYALPYESFRSKRGFPETRSLGRSIYFEEYSIGQTGDFNRNGRDELYLYRLSETAYTPCFIEFDPGRDEFKRILPYPRAEEEAVMDGEIIMLDLDPEQKKILFRELIRQDPTPIVRTFALQWDEEAQVYVESTWPEPAGAEGRMKKAFDPTLFLSIANGIVVTAVIGVLIIVIKRKRNKERKHNV